MLTSCPGTKMKSLWPVVAVLIASFLGSVTSDEPDDDFDCTIPDAGSLPTQKPLPSLFDEKLHKGYSIEMELNRRSADGKGSSGYIFEKISVKESGMDGELNLQYHNIKGRSTERVVFLYSDHDLKNDGTNPREIFTVTNDLKCRSLVGDNIDQAYTAADWFPKVILDRFNLNELSAPTPSAMFKAIEEHGTTFMGKGKPMRGYDNVEVWKMCLDGKGEGDNKRSSIINFYYANDNGNMIPLRIKVNTKGEENLDYIIAYYKPWPLDMEYSGPNIPTQHGCERMVLPDIKQQPGKFIENDFRIELEVITITASAGIGNGMTLDSETTNSQVTNAEIVYNKAHNLVAFTQTFFNEKAVNKNVGDDTVRYQIKKVIDVNEGLVYETTLTTSDCSIKELDDEFIRDVYKKDDEAGGDEVSDDDKPSIRIKREEASFENYETRDRNMWDVIPPFYFIDGSKLKIMDTDFWNPPDFLHYLGKGTARGLPVKIYERKFENKYKDSNGKTLIAIATYHYLDDDMEYDTVFAIKGAPVQIEIALFDSDMTIFQGFVTINVHSFETIILALELPATFDISNCFDEPEESTWFQMIFPVDFLVTMQVLDHEEAVEEAFRTALSEIAPSRLPQVYTDYDMDQLYITVKLLDRPPYNKAFDIEPMKQLMPKKSEDRITFLSESPFDCSTSCLVSSECTAFSYCGENLECDLFIQGPNEADKPWELQDNPVCSLYKRKFRVEPGKPVLMNRMVNELILTNLEQKIIDKAFTITINGIKGTNDKGEETVEFRDITAGKLVRNTKRGHFLDSGEDLESTRLRRVLADYVIVAKDSRFKLISDEGSTNTQFKRYPGLGIRRCAKSCTDDDNCNSFSFCNKDEGDCIFSTLKEGEIKEEHLDDMRYACTVISKSVLKSFETFQSFSITNKAAKSIKVDLPEQCAQKCLEEKDFDCRSFDFCLTAATDNITTTCLLHTYHLAANFNEREKETEKIGFNQDTSACSHYSKKYSKDFTVSSNKKFASEVTLSYESTDISKEACSHNCAEIAGSGCQAFEFCEKISKSETGPNTVTRTCRMSASRDSVTKSESDDSCNLFLKPPAPEPQSFFSKATKGRVGGGWAFFWSLFLIIIGAGLGGAAYWHFVDKTA